MRFDKMLCWAASFIFHSWFAYCFHCTFMAKNKSFDTFLTNLSRAKILSFSRKLVLFIRDEQYSPMKCLKVMQAGSRHNFSGENKDASVASFNNEWIIPRSSIFYQMSISFQRVLKFTLNKFYQIWLSWW